jgi:hypothetical protein
MQIGRAGDENVDRRRAGREGRARRKEENEREKPFHGAEV